MTPKQFIQTIHNDPSSWAPAYFFVGEEAFLHDRCRRELFRALPEEARSWCLTSVEWKSGGLPSVLEQAFQMPMVGPRNLFWIRDPQDFGQATEEDFESLKAYLKEPPPFSTLVFAAQAPDRRRRFVTLLLKQAEVVEMRRPEPHERVRWVGALLRDQQIDMDHEAAEALAEIFDGNLLWIQTELEKLRAAKPGLDRITVEDLKYLVSLAEDHEISKLIGYLADRDGGGTVVQLNRLLRSNEAELKILWYIGNLFRRSLAAGGEGGRRSAYSSRRGFGADLAAQNAAKSYSHSERLGALRAIHEADLDIKSAWRDTQLRLEYLIWKIVGKRDQSATKTASGTASGGERGALPKRV